jgi:hypothetical protein
MNTQSRTTPPASTNPVSKSHSPHVANPVTESHNPSQKEKSNNTAHPGITIPGPLAPSAPRSTGSARQTLGGAASSILGGWFSC